MSNSSITSKKLVIRECILTFRGKQVMLDRDLGILYNTQTRVLKQAVNRNKDRFPPDFMFKLSAVEINEMVSQSVIPSKSHLGGGTPYVFTEQGVAMLAAVLHSEIAISISVEILRAFVQMRRIIQKHEGILQRVQSLEFIQEDHSHKIEQVFKALESKTIPKQGVFFDGQVFDAYLFASDLITSAKRSIRLIDNYIDESVLLLLTKRPPGVLATIYTKRISKTLKLDLERHNSQYPLVNIQLFDQSHDRFLIVDDDTVYHLGASLKDLGKKWFAFSRIDKDAVKIVEKINRLCYKTKESRLDPK